MLQAGYALDFIVDKNDLDLTKDNNAECGFKTQWEFFSEAKLISQFLSTRRQLLEFKC